MAKAISTIYFIRISKWKNIIYDFNDIFLLF